MSAETDLTRIQDEDVLRKMWQESDDFGRKKEIRAHMYKVREERLKNFYNSSEITSSESQKTSSTTQKSSSDFIDFQKNQNQFNNAHKTVSTDFENNFANAQKTNMTTHADNLKDDSFLSYKSKEIRDSESPTRDISYRSLGKLQDQGWTISSTNEKSTDGKTESTCIKANTQGTQAINGGKLDYAAEHEQKASVFQDGDDKNFVKSAEAQSTSVIQQEACGGDKNSQFRSSTTKSSSSSRYVTESKSNTGNLEQTPAGAITVNQNVSEQHSTKIFTKNAPDDIRNHPNYVEGKTKVTQETKTLADGSTVTTTRYETKIGNTTQTAVTKNYSGVASSKSEKMSSSSSSSYHQSSLRDSKHSSKDTQRKIEYHIEPIGITKENRKMSTTSETSNVCSKRNRNKKDEEDYVEFIVEPIIKTKSDQQYSTTIQKTSTTTRETDQDIRDSKISVPVGSTIQIDINVDATNTHQNVDSTSKTESFSTQKTSDLLRETQQEDYTSKNIYPTKTVPSETRTTTKTTTSVISEGTTQPREVTDAKYSTTFSTDINQTQNTRNSTKTTTNEFISTERRREENARDSELDTNTKPRNFSPSKEPQQKAPKELRESSLTKESQTKSPVEPYVQPDQRQPTKPGKSELDQYPKATEGQYDTTYRSEFTSKKISVEQRAAHDAFARSLRAVTPERVRSSVSPEKQKHPATRNSPERRTERSRSPKKNADKFSSTETITYTTRRGHTPTKSTNKESIRTYSTDNITRKSKSTTDTFHSGTLTRRKNKPQDILPTDIVSTEYEYKRKDSDITTDLDLNVTTNVTNETTTTKETTRPSTLELSRKPKKITERSPTSPLNDVVSPKKSPDKINPRKSQSPTKEARSPSQERPKLIRTDTYEERVKQILGITGDAKEKRRSSLERSTLTKKGSFKETTNRSSSHHDFARSPSKESPTRETQSYRKYPDRKSPAKEGPKISESPRQVKKSPEHHFLGAYPERKSPIKENTNISEFPSQIRKSPEKQLLPSEKKLLEDYSGRKSPLNEGSKISEFPAQVRKSPQREVLDKFPEKSSPMKESPKISEFPSQIRRSPEKEKLESYLKKISPAREVSKLTEFPSQIKKSPERKTPEKYSEKPSTIKEGSNILEFPSQVRKSPQKEIAEPCPERKPSLKTAPKISEFPAQTKNIPKREHFDQYQERSLPIKTTPQISEIPNHNKTSEKEQLESYPEKHPTLKEGPKISEFPAQTRKSPERQPLETVLERPTSAKESTKIIDSPLKIYGTSDKNMQKQPETKPSSISELSTQVKKTLEQESFETIPVKEASSKKETSISEFAAQVRKSPEKSVNKVTTIIASTQGKTAKTKIKKPTTNSDSSTTDDESDTEEMVKEAVAQTTVDTLENKAPVEEPLVLKKLFSNLCRENEVITIDKKKATKDLIESEIIRNQIEQQIVDSTVVKQDSSEKELKRPTENAKKSAVPKKASYSPKKLTEPFKSVKSPSEVTEKFINKKTTETAKKSQGPVRKPNSKTDICLITKSDSSTSIEKINGIKKTSPAEKGPVKIPTKKNIIETTTTTTKKITTKEIARSPYVAKHTPIPKKTPEIYKVTKTKYVGGTECQDECCQSTKLQKQSTKRTQKLTLHKNENIEHVKEDNKQVHLGSKKVDEILTKTKTSVVPGLVNETKLKEPLKYPSLGKKPERKSDTLGKTSKSITTTQSKYSTTTIRKPTTDEVDQKPKEVKPSFPKKHTVAATVNLNLKTPKKVNTTKTTTIKSTKTKSPVRPIKLKENSYSSADSDDESITESANNSFVNMTNDKKYSTTKIDETTKTLPKQEDIFATEKIDKKTHKATKTLIITDKEGKQYQVTVDLKRSKSSREPTPDRLCPRPLTSDEEEEELPRYPDQISEPDDGFNKRKPKRLSDIPIFEAEDTHQLEKITEVTDIKNISKVNKVDESDESLLSVTKKVQKFLNTADNLTKQSNKPKPSKVSRPEFEVTEDLKSDECLLSVSDKVSKFITTAEQLVSSHNVAERPKTPVCKNYKEEINVHKKKTETETNITPKIDCPNITDADESLKEDECLLSVSEKVTKFITTAEKLTTANSNKSVSLDKIDIKRKKETQSTNSPIKAVLRSESPHKDTATECITIETEEQLFTRSPSLSPERIRSPSPHKTPDRRPSNQYSSILKTETTQSKYTPTSIIPESTQKSSRKSSLEDIDARRLSQEETTILTRRRSSTEEAKSILSTTSRLRSTESIKKAKALFENIAKDQENPRQRDILSRPSVFEARRNQTNSHVDLNKNKLDFNKKENSIITTHARKSLDKSPERLSQRFKSPEKICERLRSPDRPKSPEKRVTEAQKYSEHLIRSEKGISETKKLTERTSSPEKQRIELKNTSQEKIEITRFRPSSPNKIPESNIASRPISREQSPSDLPHYMKPLDRSLRPNSPHRENISATIPHQPQEFDEIDVRQTKFGVTLKRTDSGRLIKLTETSSKVAEDRRKSSVTLEKRVTEEEIEEIYELDVLEELLEKVIGYDLRRKIRTQIRLVKKLISEGTLEEYVIRKRREQEEPQIKKQIQKNSSSKRGFSPGKIVKTPTDIPKSTEYASSFTRKTSPERKTIDNNLYHHTDLVDASQKIHESTEYQSSYTFNTTRKSSSDYSTSTRKSPVKEIETSHFTGKKSSTIDRVQTSPIKEHAKPADKITYSPVTEKRASPLRERGKGSPLKERASPIRNGYSTKSKSPSPTREYNTSNRRDSETKISKVVETTPYSTTTTVRKTEKLPNGVKTTTTKTTESQMFTTLKRSTPNTTDHKTVKENIPEWVKNRNLRKTAETNAPVSNKKISSTSSSTTTRKTTSTSRKSPVKEVKSTDLITSSYGVGPTDENGAPLFGLRALRAKNSKNVETKVQGTVIQSQFYSENGHEPVGQVSVTKYSTDPTDLQQNGDHHQDGTIASVTTTQKFGYENTPSLSSLTDNRKEVYDSTDEIITSKTSRINRRGSVKALSQKFIDNAVETLKSERQTTYPKAGLILRSSSFKSSGDEEKSDSRETSPMERELVDTTASTTVRTCKTSSSTGETFLTNKNKISGVQDVLTRMKNEDYQEGDSPEDVKARGLLNKFLGAQVMLTGMESRISSKAKTSVTTSPSGVVKKSTTITTTVTEEGKPTTTTRIFQHPVTEQELETVWEEQSLKLLLEQSSEYEERRFIRARLRQLMAEQEACTALVDQATKDESTPSSTPTTPTGIEGESQLLPLLQGLLEAPQNDITPDSGTESGEDQRSNLIQEVQNALEKLSISLKSDQTDISLDRKNSLLTLVSKLQAGLSNNDRRASTQSTGRFHKRKNRQSRHTVGVSKEELAHARKLIEEIALTPSESLATIPVLSKQNSESSVPTSSNSSYRSIQQAKVINAVAKPFSRSNSSSAIQTPTDPFEGFDILFGDNTDLTYHKPASVQDKALPNIEKAIVVPTRATQRTTSQESTISNTSSSNNSIDSNVSIKSAVAAVKKAALEKVSSMENTKENDDASETEDSSTIKGTSNVETPLKENPLIKQETLTVKISATNLNAPLKENPIYTKPENDASNSLSLDEKSKRFDTNKKLKMKRANTIDIPKPLNFYHDDNESDTDHEHDLQRQHKDNYYALRGPIRVGNPNTKNIVPAFQPKTESDKKFMAFINKQNDGGENKNTPWARNNAIWGNKFGNIKNTFEKATSNDAKPFWKSADDNLTHRSQNFGPKISRQSAKNLQQMFAEKQRDSQKSMPWSAQGNVVTGSLQLKTEPVKHYKVVPAKVAEPKPVNDFSHASKSAFQPAPKKVVQQQPSSNRNSLILSPEGSEIIKCKVKDNSSNESVFLYSPKPLDLPKPVISSSLTSPTTSRPWLSNNTGGRVLSLAASKFEQPPSEPVKPRKLSKDAHKAFLSQENVSKIDRTAPYLAQSAETKTNIVRKLSGQYEDIQTKPIATPNTTHQMNAQINQKTFPPNQNYSKHYTPTNTKHYSSKPQNYSIRYDQPSQKSVPASQVNPTHPVNYSIRYDQFQKSGPLSQKIQDFSTQPQNYSIRYDQTQKITPASPQTQNYSIKYDKPITVPQNFSLQHDQQPTDPLQSQTLNYSIAYDQPHAQSPGYQPHSQTFQHLPAKNQTPMSPKISQEKEYTSNFDFKPQQKVSPMEPRPQIQDQNDAKSLQVRNETKPQLQSQISNESVHEYLAVNSKVMSGPIAQTATTVRQKSPMSRNDHDIEAALGLKDALQKVNQNVDKGIPNVPESRPIQRNSDSFKLKQSANSAFVQVTSDSTKKLSLEGYTNQPQKSKVTNDSFRHRQMAEEPTLSAVVNNARCTQDSFKQKSTSDSFKFKQSSNNFKFNPSEIPNSSVSSTRFKFKTDIEGKNTGVVKPMQQVPRANPVYNNVSKPREKLHINERGQSVVTGQFHIPVINVKSPETPRPPTHAQVLSKSDSWHQICMETQKVGQTQAKPQQGGVVKSKSSHSLSVPKLFEAGLSKEEMMDKRRAMEAFLTGNKSPNEGTKIIKKTSINRVKTSEKVSASSRGFSGLARSKTLPDMIVPELLDESNVDQAFEELFKSS